MRIDWHKYIAVDFDVHHGEPCINGIRVPVSMIVGSVADGITSGHGVGISRADESGRTSG